MSKLDENDLRVAFGSFMTGVTVVTTRAPNGTLVGFTANSFTSVSMDPPLLLVCPGNHLSSFSVFQQIESFAVNVLSHSQESVSNLFASAEESRFDQVEWQADENGSPILADVAASFSCVVHDRVSAGDHLILIGCVTDYAKSSDGGLGYCSGGYFSLEKERQADTLPRSGCAGFAGTLIEFNDCLLMNKTDDGICVPSLALDDQQGARSTLVQHFASIGLLASIGPVYSLYDDTTKISRYTFFKATVATGNTGGLGEYIPISELSSHVFADAAQQVMIERFIRENESKEFGLYIGDSQVGEVHRDVQ